MYNTRNDKKNSDIKPCNYSHEKGDRLPQIFEPPNSRNRIKVFVPFFPSKTINDRTSRPFLPVRSEGVTSVAIHSFIRIKPLPEPLFFPTKGKMDRSIYVVDI